jgi:cytochrome c oxidase subunit IV
MAEHGTESKLFMGGKPVSGHIESHEHVSPAILYAKVLGALLVLTGLTYAVSFADLGPASLAVALLVAFTKATLVCAFFMHLKYDDRFHVFIFVSTILFVGIFFTFTIFDLSSRTELDEAQDTFHRRNSGDWNDRTYSKVPPPPPSAAADAAAGEAEAPADAKAPH